MNMDLLTQLSDEHQTLLACLQEIQLAAENRDAAGLAASIETAKHALTEELDAHIATEEEVAFTAIEDALDAQLVAPFREEHQEIRAIRDKVFAESGAGNMPYGMCLQLCDLIVAHQQREDMMLFPSAREALDVNALKAKP